MKAAICVCVTESIGQLTKKHYIQHLDNKK